MKYGTIVVAQNIIFPKSIKSFLKAAFPVMSEKYQIIWQYKTTPQGILVAVKISN
jgi:hypothetical protein